MGNHIFSWVNPLQMAIFNSKLLVYQWRIIITAGKVGPWGMISTKSKLPEASPRCETWLKTTMFHGQISTIP
jgi:hypothetical protein